MQSQFRRSRIHIPGAALRRQIHMARRSAAVALVCDLLAAVGLLTASILFCLLMLFV